MTADEQAELEQLRRSARLFMTDPLDKAFFKLDSILENQKERRLDSIMPSHSFYVLAECLKELRRHIDAK
jgi:hypothetical protein